MSKSKKRKRKTRYRIQPLGIILLVLILLIIAACVVLFAGRPFEVGGGGFLSPTATPTPTPEPTPTPTPEMDQPVDKKDNGSVLLPILGCAGGVVTVAAVAFWAIQSKKGRRART